MKIWVVETELEGGYVSAHRSRDTAMERAEEYMKDHDGQFAGEGYSGWSPVHPHKPNGSMKIYYRTPHNGYYMYVYETELED